ncbi:TonB-dependent hemoglobin/transferrin/lactoferrin family receptor [uncultured Endozoicomonas sp.]|uniref:TonB-dependent hemoglobin/transferrin/lactoferrin family receptor n=1 Tax=uncultured Endozoicomonas sp. TaxID=432652 RepID=UPI00261C06B8|nr:TonB-dependent hemoglobin/transferrin/lactoferrin family receptor [uncultured Endozoicomonas sp.]
MKFSKNSLALAVMAATVSLVQTSAVLAETSAEDSPKKYQPTLMNQVTVTATRSEKQLKDVAGAVTVIDNSQMEKEMVQNIKDLVRYEPGVQVTEGLRGGQDGFTIRGMSGNRVKISVDGVDQAQSFSVGTGSEFMSAQRNFVDVETLKAVEIVKGPASSLYGSDAIGGMVAFQTKDPSDLLKSEGDDTSASIKAGYASVNEGFTETISLANRSGDLETMLIYTRRDSKEMDTNGGANIDGSARGQANPSDNGLNNLLSKAQYQLNDNHRIGFTGEFFDSKTDTQLKTGGVVSKGSTGEDTAERYRIGFEHQWDAELSLFDSMDWQINLQDSETRMKTNHPYSSYYKSRRIKDYQYSEKSVLLDAQFNKELTAGLLTHNFVYGINISHTKVDNTSNEYYLDKPDSSLLNKDYIDPITAQQFGIFIQDDIQVNERLNIVAGLRYDEFEFETSGMMQDPNSSKEIAAPDSTGNKVTGRLGTIYDLNDNLSVFAQFSQGFKAPGYLATYYSYESNPSYGDPSKLLANPDLKPEESNSYELGLRGNNHVGSFEVTGFYNKYENFIEQVEVDYDPAKKMRIFQNQNLSEVTIKGIELKGEFWLDSTINAPEGTVLRGSLAWSEGKDEEKNEFLNSVAPLTAVIGLGYDAPSELWGGEMALTLVKGKKDSKVTNVNQGEPSEQEQFNPAGYGVVDFTGYYKPIDDLILRAGLFNITDKKYWNLNDVNNEPTTDLALDRYAQPGRNVAVNMTYTF